MKQVRKLKLSQLSKNELEKKELKKLKGGGGGSANASANHSGDLYSPGGGYGWGY